MAIPNVSRSPYTHYHKYASGRIEYFKPPTPDNLASPEWRKCVRDNQAKSWNTEIVLTTPSRVVIDMYKIIQEGQFRLRRETLDAVSSHFLGGETKENVKYKDMLRLFHGGPDDRKKIASYCVQDCMLPLKLMTKLTTLASTLQFAKVNMIPMRYVHGKGQQIRAFSLILHEAKARNMIFPPFVPPVGMDSFQGATVVEPYRGFYQSPVLTLDFASLYPSIIIAYNLCFTTLKTNVGENVGEMVYHRNARLVCDKVSDEEPRRQATTGAVFSRGIKPELKKKHNVKRLQRGQTTLDKFVSKSRKTSVPAAIARASASHKEEVEFANGEILTPSGDRFVDPSVRLGVIPKVIVRLLNARREVRAEMKKETDPFVKMLLNNQQLAIKCTANPMYGFTGALEKGVLSCVQVSRSVTAFGRRLIRRTKAYVGEYQERVDDGEFAEEYVEVPPPRNLSVIYGDTDSVMIKTPDGTSIETALVWGEKICEWINGHHRRPIELEFEKIYCPYILFTKKRYAGRMFVDANTPPKVDCKGLENVRRDTCPYVSEVVSETISILVEKNDVKGAVAYASKALCDLKNQKVTIDKLLMTRALSKKEYKSTMPHVEVARKMASRNPGSEPRGGERVQFVMKAFKPYEVERLRGTDYLTGKLVKAAYRAEDPAHLLNSVDEDIDYEDYVKMLKPPLLRIFSVVLACHEAEAARIVFGASDGIRNRPALETSAPLARFVVRQPRCTKCRKRKSSSSVDQGCDCGANDGDCDESVHDGIGAHAEKVLNFLDICKRCTGKKSAGEISCTNQDCKYFFLRKECARLFDRRYGKVSHAECNECRGKPCSVALCMRELRDMLDW
ncbi:DNA polymerase delta catalytic subunit-like [Ixodes scapularis]|uniref:DNA polymerase delta catalytic subunit-like n=1 Tax=Ixodes scapularis TaxID=6945 RepID=UPI001A9F0963|nr:DNA polymerase delta catalytic subunit-like [Ixodes scapularis]